MTTLAANTLITRVPGLLETEMDGEAVLMHVDRGQYFGLAKTAKAIWEALAQPCTLEALCASLQQRYKAPAGVIEADAQRFVAQMHEEGLVTLEPQP